MTFLGDGIQSLGNGDVEKCLFDESNVLLRHVDIQVHIWRTQHETFESEFIKVQKADGGGVMVWRIFSWYSIDHVSLFHELATGIASY